MNHSAAAIFTRAVRAYSVTGGTERRNRRIRGPFLFSIFASASPPPLFLLLLVFPPLESLPLPLLLLLLLLFLTLPFSLFTFVIYFISFYLLISSRLDSILFPFRFVSPATFIFEFISLLPSSLSFSLYPSFSLLFLIPTEKRKINRTELVAYVIIIILDFDTLKRPDR